MEGDKRRDMQRFDLFRELKKRYDDLTGSQKKIGKYILDHYERISFMSAVELAQAVGVSDATIIRFTRTLGFEGYQQFRECLREGVHAFDSPDSRASRSMELLREKADFISRVGQIDLDNLMYFLRGLHWKKVDLAVDAIYAARQIYLVGKGSASIVTQFLELHLRRMGFPIKNIGEAAAVSPEKLVGMAQEDLLIACGFPRYSKDTYNAINFAKQRGATVLTITDSDLTALAVKSDIVLTVKVDNTAFFHSYIVPIELCNILLLKVLERGGEAIYAKLRQNIDSLQVFDMTL